VTAVLTVSLLALETCQAGWPGRSACGRAAPGGRCGRARGRNGYDGAKARSIPFSPPGWLAF